MPELAEDEARRRFAAARVARLATVDGNGRPHLVPVVFARYGADGIVTAVDHKPKTTPRLKRLRNIAAQPSVCLLADAYDEDWDRLWWVRADGHATVVPAAAALVEPLCAKYPQYRERPPDGAVVLVTVSRWTGWQAAPF
ncbi:TIGR03668 family PPOX class F420-dependent oxidoreductase [Streptomyces sp. NPDC054770]